MNRYSSILPGDRLLVNKGYFITHSGTYMGNGLVAHINPEKGATIELLEAFSAGQDIRIKQNGGIAIPLLWQRWNTLKSDTNYRMTSNNCEQFCNYLETGKRFSPQLQGGIAGLGFSLLTVKQLKINNGWWALAYLSVCTVVGAKLGAPKPTMANQQMAADLT